jgi:hypothetical protein
VKFGRHHAPSRAAARVSVAAGGGKNPAGNGGAEAAAAPGMGCSIYFAAKEKLRLALQSETKIAFAKRLNL